MLLKILEYFHPLSRIFLPLAAHSFTDHSQVSAGRVGLMTTNLQTLLSTILPVMKGRILSKRNLIRLIYPWCPIPFACLYISRTTFSYFSVFPTRPLTDDTCCLSVCVCACPLSPSYRKTPVNRDYILCREVQNKTFVL